MSTSNDRGFESFKEPEEQGKIVKCPSCGGNYDFRPRHSKRFTANIAGTGLISKKDKEVKEIAIEKGFLPRRKNGMTRLPCVATTAARKSLFQPTKSPPDALYCGTAQIKKTEEIAGIKAQRRLPFHRYRARRGRLCEKMVQKRLFAPRKFKKEIAADNLKAFFSRALLFDSDTFFYL